MLEFIMSGVKKVCSRQGRNPWRRKKSYLLMGFCGIVLYVFIQMTQFNDGYTALRPLSDAQSEGKRLLKYITHYHYQCNNTLQIGNRSHWPICLEKEAGIDVESRDTKIMYTVGSNLDLMVERHLSNNHSFQVFIISPLDLPQWARQTNNTYGVKASLVPNDPADFSRNSYGQKTLNTVLSELRHRQVDILRLVNLEKGVNMWELVHFLNYDNLLLNVQQIHIAMNIEKLDEDYLYNWYRALYELFYKEGFRLYHTSSRDSLCLQVTLMESCLYYLAFIRNPGPRVFVLHPPADFGTVELEEDRLLHHLSSPRVECKQRVVSGRDDSALRFTPGNPTRLQWPVCAASTYKVFAAPCHVVRLRASNDHTLEQRFIHEGCSVYTVEPASRQSSMLLKAFRVHSHHPDGRSRSGGAQSRSFDEVLHLFRELSDISLLELDLMGLEWDLLGQLMDNGALQNVTQIVANVQIPDNALGRHPTVYRSHYSELRRLEMQGFDIFYSSPLGLNTEGAPRALGHFLTIKDCCYKIGFLKKENFYR